MKNVRRNYCKEREGHILIVAVYVYDLLVSGSRLDMIREFKQGMATRFEMSDLGKLSYYLGIGVIQQEGSTVLSQERYATKILEEAGMKGCNTVHMPMDARLKMSRAKEERSVDARDYRRNIGCQYSFGT